MPGRTSKCELWAEIVDLNDRSIFRLHCNRVKSYWRTKKHEYFNFMHYLGFSPSNGCSKCCYLMFIANMHEFRATPREIEMHTNKKKKTNVLNVHKNKWYEMWQSFDAHIWTCSNFINYGSVSSFNTLFNTTEEDLRSSTFSKQIEPISTLYGWTLQMTPFWFI